MSKKEQDVQDLTLAAEQLEAAVGKHSPLMIHVLRPLVNRLNAEGLYSQARPYIEQILDIRRQSADVNLPSLSDAYLAYVESLRRSGDHIEAITAASQLLVEAKEEKRGEDFEAQVRLMVSDSYVESGDLKRGIAQLLAAIALIEKQADAKVGQVISAYGRLADLFEQSGEIDKAVDAVEKRFSLFEGVLGDGQALVPELRDLIAFYRRIGRNEKADALETRRRTLRNRMDA